MQQPRHIRVIVENIPGLAASATLDAAGTLWIVVGECQPGESRRQDVYDAVRQLLGPEGQAEYLLRSDQLIEFGDSCTRFQPAPPARLLEAVAS